MNRKIKHQPDDTFTNKIDNKVDSKIASRKNSTTNLWFGIGMMGIVGWSVALPTLGGIALGIWLDNNTTDKYSWTLMMLFAGLITGCLTAWHWVAKEHREIDKKGVHKDVR